MPKTPASYWDYIAVDQILSLQSGVEESESSVSNDELMFITIHQIDELWFKLLLRELETIQNLIKSPEIPEQSLSIVVRSLRRGIQLFSHLTSHFALMETMTTRDYLSFRDKLSPASGFQSAQMRELEIILGLEENQRIRYGKEGSFLEALKNTDGTESSQYKKVQQRISETPSIAKALSEWLYRTPISGSTPSSANDPNKVTAFIDGYLAAQRGELEHAKRYALHNGLSGEERSRLEERFDREAASAKAFLYAEDCDEAIRKKQSRIRAATVYIESYRELPLLAWPREVLDSVIALEENFVIFRQRHARMVERIIGRRTGTGGSSGVDYLEETARKYRIFPELWAARTYLIRRDALPPVENPAAYSLQVETDRNSYPPKWQPS